MKRIIVALEEKSSGPKAPVADDRPSDTVSVEDVLMPDIYGENNDDAEPLLDILDTSSPDDESTGCNPYDTAVLQKK